MCFWFRIWQVLTIYHQSLVAAIHYQDIWTVHIRYLDSTWHDDERFLNFTHHTHILVVIEILEISVGFLLNYQMISFRIYSKMIYLKFLLRQDWPTPPHYHQHPCCIMGVYFIRNILLFLTSSWKILTVLKFFKKKGQWLNCHSSFIVQSWTLLSVAKATLQSQMSIGLLVR